MRVFCRPCHRKESFKLALPRSRNHSNGFGGKFLCTTAAAGTAFALPAATASASAEPVASAAEQYLRLLSVDKLCGILRTTVPEIIKQPKLQLMDFYGHKLPRFNHGGSVTGVFKRHNKLHFGIWHG